MIRVETGFWRFAFESGGHRIVAEILYWRKGVWYGENREKSDTGLDREML